MTKADLIDMVASQTQYAQKDITATVNDLLEAIKDSMARGKNIEIRGFGTYKIKTRKARKARNPRNGHTVMVPDRNVPVFKFSKEVIERVINSKANKAGQ